MPKDELLGSFGIFPHNFEKSDEDWLAEIERRARVAIAGEPGISWEEVRAAIEQRLPRK